MIKIPQSVKDAYNEPHRKYHNLQHIESILSKAQFWFSPSLNDWDMQILALAAWYHDVVYEPGSPENEVKSARLFVSDHPGLNEPMVDAVLDIILGTRTHKSPRAWLQAIFYDLDLADMGTSNYVGNSYKIREEFKEFSDLEWLAGRRKFLGDFLNRQTIYHTATGYALWEDKARRNMEMELSFLEGKYGK